MQALAHIIRQESTLTLIREAAWRTRKRWKIMRFQAEIRGAGCPVRYEPAGYYQPQHELIPDAARRAILKFSDLLCEGKFCWFGYGPVELGTPPQWNLDFVSGLTWSLSPSESLPLMRHDGSDVKVPWEISRLQFLPVLGKGWLLSRKPFYRDTARNLLDDWITRNPVGFGINWTLAMEAALRAMSICFLLELLGPFSSGEQGWLQKVTKSLWEHLLFIEAHNEFSHFARSNHYLSNLVGLLHLSFSLAGPGMAVRREKYRKLLEHEMLHQVRDDGFDHEASTGYHLLATQMFTSVAMILRHKERPVSPQFLERLRKMYEVLHRLADDHGNIPGIGDCDDGRVELLTDDLEQITDPDCPERVSLRAGSWIGIGRALLNEGCGGRKDDIGWYGFELSQVRTKPCVKRSGSQVFRSSGVAIARTPNAELLFLAMPNGICGKGSHTHNDKLSIILRVGGCEVFSDSGTFCYSRHAADRNSFRSTLAHNTVNVGGEEQNRYSSLPDRLFRMSNDATVSEIESEQTSSAISFSACHQGYSRFGVTHRRKVTLAQTEATTEDVITGSGRHLVEAAWHVPGAWHVQSVRDAGVMLECLLDGPCSVRMTFSASSDTRLECTSAKISSAYGTARKSTRIKLRANPDLPFELRTCISFGEA